MMSHDFLPGYYNDPTHIQWWSSVMIDCICVIPFYLCMCQLGCATLKRGAVVLWDVVIGGPRSAFPCSAVGCEEYDAYRAYWLPCGLMYPSLTLLPTPLINTSLTHAGGLGCWSVPPPLSVISAPQFYLHSPSPLWYITWSGGLGTLQVVEVWMSTVDKLLCGLITSVTSSLIGLYSSFFLIYSHTPNHTVDISPSAQSGRETGSVFSGVGIGWWEPGCIPQSRLPIGSSLQYPFLTGVAVGDLLNCHHCHTIVQVYCE